MRFPIEDKGAHAVSYCKYVCRALVALALSATVIQFCLTSFPHRVSHGFEIQTIDKLYLVLLFLGLVSLPFVFIPTSSRADRTNLLSKLQVFTTFLTGTIVATWAWRDGAPQAGAILFSGLLATMGWIITQRNARAASKKQHTFNMLVQLKNSDLLRYHLANIVIRYPFGANVKPEDVQELLAARTAWKPGKLDPTDRSSYPVYASIIWVLNSYEYIAAGIYSGDLDEQPIKQSLRATICKQYAKFYHCIRDAQKRTYDEIPTTESFVYLSWLFDQWATDTDRLAIGHAW